jgi:hypothetical protein
VLPCQCFQMDSTSWGLGIAWLRSRTSRSRLLFLFMCFWFPKSRTLWVLHLLPICVYLSSF